MTWLSENWLLVLLIVGVLFFMFRRGGMGCGFGGHAGHHGAGRDESAPGEPVGGQRVSGDGGTTTARSRTEAQQGHRHGGHGCC